MEKIGKYMKAEIHPRQPNKKTDRWEILNIKDGFLLGMVFWYPRWRQYCFSPVPEITIFSHDCLTAIAAFIEKEMEGRK